jgi:hypothetical protein
MEEGKNKEEFKELKSGRRQRREAGMKERMKEFVKQKKNKGRKEERKE